MSGLDFVFQFSSKGDEDVNKKIEDLKSAVSDLNKEIVLAMENNKKLKKSFSEGKPKDKVKEKTKETEAIEDETAKINKQIDAERKQYNADKRRVKALEDKRKRGLKLSEEEQRVITRFYNDETKFDQAKIKRLTDEGRLQISNVEKELEGQEKIEKNADKNHKKEIKRAKEKMRMGGLVRGALKLTAAALGVTFGVQYLREQFGKELGSQMTGTFTNLPSNFLVGIGQASRKFGGNPEAVQQAIGRLQRNLTLQRTDAGIANDLQRNLAMTGLVGGKGGLTREEVWTTDARELLSGIARSYQNLPESKQRQSKEYLANVLGDMSLVNMLTSGDYESLVSEYSNKPEKENIQRGAEVEAELKAKIEDGIRTSIDKFFEMLGEIIDKTKESGARAGFDTIMDKWGANIGEHPVLNAPQMPVYGLISGIVKGYDFISSLFSNDEVKAGGEMSNAVNGAGGKVEINNTYEDNSVTEVNSVEEANQSKEGRVSAANAVFSTGKRMAMGSSLQATGV